MLGEKIKKGYWSFIKKDNKEFCKNKNIEIEYIPRRLHYGTWVIERAIETLKSLNVANLQDKIGSTESIKKPWENFNSPFTPD